MKRRSAIALFLLLSSGCDEAGPLEIEGAYADDLNVDHVIALGWWTMSIATESASYAITHHDNEEQTVIAHNAESNAEYASLWSRIDWTFDDGGQLWFCHTIPDANSEENALSGTPADATLPAEGGCRGGPWLRLRQPLFVRGDWTDNYGTSHTITQTTWTQTSTYATGVFHITTIDNDAHMLVAQNDADNPYFPDLWSRFDWVTVDDTLWYCQTTYASATEADALAATPADATSPGTSGCGGFAWSNLTEAP